MAIRLVATTGDFVHPTVDDGGLGGIGGLQLCTRGRGRVEFRTPDEPPSPVPTRVAAPWTVRVRSGARPPGPGPPTPRLIRSRLRRPVPEPARCSRALAVGMRISEASRISGVSARSLRHYEDEGLIVPGRFSNGFRDYCQSTIDRVLVIRSLLDSGLPVRLIREILPRLTDGSEAGAEAVCAEFLHEVESYRDRLAARIAVLSDQQAALDAYLRDARRSDL